ncbi:MAG: hypothetical protein IJ784_02585, partial [Ruminiclostridium sp.]|nr:hypothetical protein [Ruminiclostridium sp.]
MNRSIKGWFTAVIGAELVTAAFEILVLCGGIGSGLSTAYHNVCTMSIMFFAGVWFPILFGFVGKCIETKFKRLKAMPIAAADASCCTYFIVSDTCCRRVHFLAAVRHTLPVRSIPLFFHVLGTAYDCSSSYLHRNDNGGAPT